MLSGQRLFGGDTVVHTLADVLRRSIEFTSREGPAPIKTLLRRCLDRDGKTRLRDIGEARIALESLANPAHEDGLECLPTPSEPWSKKVAWVVAGVLALALSSAGFGWWRSTRPVDSAAGPAQRGLGTGCRDGRTHNCGSLSGRHANRVSHSWIKRHSPTRNANAR